jgi:hypothetical protein
MTMGLTVSDIESLKQQISDMDAKLSMYMDGGPSAEEAAEVLVALNIMKRDMSVMYDSFSGRFASLLGNGAAIETASGATIEKKGAADRKKWNHEELASRVAERLSEMAVDMDTGEIVMTPSQMVQKLLDYAAVSYWRVGKLGELGINPDSYCEQGDYKTSIIVRLGDKK